MLIEIRQTDEFSRWFDRLTDLQARARILARIRRLSLGNFGDTESVGDGVLELRIHQGPGYRVYLKLAGMGVVVLLAGGSKRTQDRDVQKRKNWPGDFEEAVGPMIGTHVWDAAEHLRSDEDIVAYLEAVLEEGDATLFAAALGDVARAKGMQRIARDTGLGRESLYKALSPDGNPEFGTILKVMRSLGLRLHAGVGAAAGSASSSQRRPE